jgi:hypothetical protein
MYPSANTMRWSARPTLEHLVEMVPQMVRAFAVGTETLGLRPDLPIVPALAIVAAIVVSTNRWLWRGLLAAHAGLLVWLVANANGAGALWPRRVLLLEALSVLTIAVAAADRPRWRPLFLAVLLVGNAWQLRETFAWVRSPASHHEGFRYALPYTHAELDYYVPMFVTPWYDVILADIEAGRRVVLLYNLSSYWENSTDPTGIPERLYVALGHDRFMEKVAIFGSVTLRQHIFQTRPMSELDAWVNGIANPDDVVVHGLLSPLDSPTGIAEWNEIMSALDRRFRMVFEPTGFADPPVVEWQRWLLLPRPAP